MVPFMMRDKTHEAYMGGRGRPSPASPPPSGWEKMGRLHSPFLSSHNYNPLGEYINIFTNLYLYIYVYGWNVSSHALLSS